MNEKLSEELLARLDLLAAKLNTTGEHLWEVLTRQGYIVGAYGLFTLVAGLLMVVAACYCWNKAYKLDKDNDYDWAGGLGFLGVLSGILAIVGIVNGLVQTRFLFNPEYYALTKVLGLFQ